MLNTNCISCAFGPGSIASRGLLFGAETASRNCAPEWDGLSGRAPSGNCIPEFGWETGCAFRKGPQRKLRPRIRLQNGMHFPLEPSAETASRNQASEWDVLSARHTIRKMYPTLERDSGMRFPSGARSESASQFEHLFRDVLSAECIIRKAYPVLGVGTGLRFPSEELLGKHAPDWRDMTQRHVLQQPLQLDLAEPCRQHSLPDACRLQLFGEHSCRADLVHGKAKQRVAVER